MGVLYGWKKEYLLEEMTLGQIVMYYVYGLEFKYPQTRPDHGGHEELAGMTIEEQRVYLRKTYGEDIEGL